MDKFTSPFKIGKTLNVMFLLNIFICFHYYLIVYLNSTLLSQYFSEAQISTLYVVAAIITIILFINFSRIINTFGNYKTTLYALIFEILATIGLTVTVNPFLTGLYFVIHAIIITLIGLNLDVFLEGVIPDEHKTGNIRSMYNTIGNLILVISPLIISIILIGNTYWHVYLLSSLFILPAIYYLRSYFKNSTTEPSPYINIRATLKEYIADKNLYNIFASEFLLQLFYAFMVVYTPLYLVKYIGFSWSEIGIIFTIMLLPFIIFEVPVGDLADEKYGEKEFLTVGFIVMGLATLCIGFITAKSFFIWATILFITRIGASVVEITTDSYFFKHVDANRTGAISFYRMSRPLSYIVAPIIATLSLQFIPFQYTFIIIGALMIFGTRYSLALVDTK